MSILEKIEPTILRKYLTECCILALAGCVVFLFLAMNDLNKFIRTELSSQRDNMIRTLDRNTDALNRLDRTERFISPSK